jgi:sec-independent protein translocase protein TatA
MLPLFQSAKYGIFRLNDKNGCGSGKHFQTSLNVFHSNCTVFHLICTIFESEKIRNMSDVLLGLMGIGSGEIIIIALVVLLLFGGRKIPELMRGIGKGIRSFKDGMNEVKEEIDKPVDNNTDKKK